MMWPTVDSSTYIPTSATSPQTAVVPSAFFQKPEPDYFSLHHPHEQIASYHAINNLGFATPQCNGIRTTPGPMKKKPEKVPTEKKDEVYKERRRKNNDSARRSRELRRKKEEETYQRCRILEQQNAFLLRQLYAMQQQMIHLSANTSAGPYMLPNLPAMDGGALSV